MTLKKIVIFSAFLFSLPVLAGPVFAAAPPVSGSLLDYDANNLATKAPYWYPCHDWKFSWFMPCTSTPVLRLTLTFSPAIHSPIFFPPIFLNPRSLPLTRDLTIDLPDRLEFTLPKVSGAFTPTLVSTISFIPSGGLGGVGGLLGSGSPSKDLTVTLPPITFAPITDISAEPVSLVLPLPGSVIVPVPPPLTVPSPFPGGATFPVPVPGVTPPPTPPAPSPVSPISGGPSGGLFGPVIDFFGGLFGGITGGAGGSYDFGDAPDGAVAYPDTSGSGGASGPTSCVSYVDSTPGPYKTTATAICGFTCASGAPAIDFYTGDGTPFISLISPPDGYACNGKPTLGPSSIGCSCH